MTSTAYYSTTFGEDVETVWSAIRRFDDYQWGEGVGESGIEDDQPANEPGAIRSFLYYGQRSRQRLLAHSDERRLQQWESVEAFDPTLSHYTATLHVAPIIAPGGTFVEWTAESTRPPPHRRAGIRCSSNSSGSPSSACAASCREGARELGHADGPSVPSIVSPALARARAKRDQAVH